MRALRRPIGFGGGRVPKIFAADQLEDRQAQEIVADIPIKDQVSPAETSVMRNSGLLRIYNLECHQLRIEAPKHSPSPNAVHSNGNDPQSNSSTSARPMTFPSWPCEVAATG